MNDFVSPEASTAASAARSNEPADARRTFLDTVKRKLSNQDFATAAILTLICAATRIYAIPASLWEWDDIDFARSIHRYSIPDHSPHPPGFPVFVAMARMAYALLGDEHAALVAVNVIFTSFLGAVLYFLYLELFRNRYVAIAGSVLGCFAPSLWVHSGIARSDGPTLMLGLIAMLLVLKGRRLKWALVAGCAVLALGMGVRVTVVPLVGPALAIVVFKRLRQREWRVVAMSALVGLVIVLSWYVPMIVHTTWKVYQHEMATQSEYIWISDTIFSPNIFNDVRFSSFFLRIWGALWIAWTIYVLSAVGFLLLLIRQRLALAWMLLCWVPYIAFTLIMNTPMGAIVYSMPYIPFFTGLVAYGLVVPFQWAAGSRQTIFARVLRPAGVFVCVLLAAGLISWSAPLVRILRRQESPPVRAMKYLQNRLNDTQDMLLFDKGLTPHTTFYLEKKTTRPLQPLRSEEVNLINPMMLTGRTLAATPGPIDGEFPNHFHWPAGTAVRRLHTLSIGRYFDVYVTDITNLTRINYRTGWYDLETGGGQSWRWMGRQGTVALMTTSDSMTLRLRAHVAKNPDAGPPTKVVVSLNGVQIAAFSPANSEIDETITVKGNPEFLWSTLTLKTDHVFVPSRSGASNDNRELGLQCFGIEWKPAPNSKPLTRSPEQFLGEGWYPVEINRKSLQRWTSERAVVHLPPIQGEGELEVTMTAPNPGPFSLEINGHVIKKGQTGPDGITATYRIPKEIHGEARAELVMKANTVVLPGDGRPLGLGVYYLSWMPAGR